MDGSLRKAPSTGRQHLYTLYPMPQSGAIHFFRMWLFTKFPKFCLTIYDSFFILYLKLANAHHNPTFI